MFLQIKQIVTEDRQHSIVDSYIKINNIVYIRKSENAKFGEFIPKSTICADHSHECESRLEVCPKWNRDRCPEDTACDQMNCNMIHCLDEPEDLVKSISKRIFLPDSYWINVDKISKMYVNKYGFVNLVMENNFKLNSYQTIEQIKESIENPSQKIEQKRSEGLNLKDPEVKDSLFNGGK